MFDAFKGLVKIAKTRRVQNDGSVFRLHHTVTVIILIAFFMIITTKQLAGEPIECDSHGNTPIKLINSYCFIHATFSVRKAFGLKVGKEVIYHGIQSGKDADRSEYIYHTYYQWVCFIFLIEAVFFYVPNWIWKTWEGGRMEAIVANRFNADMSESKRRNRINSVANFLISVKGQNNWYAGKYFFCEFLALVNVFFQMLLLDSFLGGNFYDYGFQALKYTQMDPEIRTDALIRVFPRMAKCEFHKFGSSGKIQTFDALCLLPINVINEKIFIFLWFWFLILAILTFITVSFRILLIKVGTFRKYLFKWRFGFNGMKEFESYFMFGDLFLLYMLGENVDLFVFQQILENLMKKIGSGSNSVKSKKGTQTKTEKNECIESGQESDDSDDSNDSSDSDDPEDKKNIGLIGDKIV